MGVRWLGIRRVATAIAAATLVSACDGGTDPAPRPAAIEVTPTETSLDALGATVALQARVVDEQGRTVEGQPVTWTSQDPAVATVSTAGVVTARGPGTTSVTARSGELQEPAVIRVSQVATALTVVAGDGQVAAAGSELPEEVTVRADDRLGSAVAEASVGFSVAAGGGTADPTTATTGSDGRASTTWTLGGDASAAQELVATAGDVSVTLTAEAVAGPPARVEVASGDGQAGVRGTPLPDPVHVVVEDAFGNRVPGQAVAFEVASGGGQVTPAQATTDADGSASATWTLGADLGEQTLVASAGAGMAVVAGLATKEPAVVARSSAGNQVATVGTAVPDPPRVTVRDEDGAPVPGVMVTFVVVTGDGELAVGAGSGSTAGLPGRSVGRRDPPPLPAEGEAVTRRTDGQGRAGVSAWTLGTASGSQRVEAEVQGLPVVAFTASAVPGPPASFTKISGDGQVATALNTLPFPLVVEVRDGFGNPVSGVTVAFQPATGSVDPAVALSASGGRASTEWTLGATQGQQLLSASVAGLPPLTFRASATPAGGGLYSIELQYLTGTTPTQQAAFDDAVATWSRIITGDVVDQVVNLEAGACGDPDQPALSNRAVDDVLVFVSVEPIDGPGGILAQAGPCVVRGSVPGLPVVGLMRFDAADLAALEGDGQLGEVIEHELGHVLGFGTRWAASGFLKSPSITQPWADTHFDGPVAVAAFDDIGGAGYPGSKVPVDNTGVPGTADAHWRESVFEHELMTGTIDGGVPNPLSPVTLGSMADLGYVVDYNEAGSYTLPSAPPRAAQDRAGPRLVGDVLEIPILVVDGAGKVTVPTIPSPPAPASRTRAPWPGASRDPR